MSGFELLGDAADETRMLIHREAGYSIPIPGHPRLVEATVATPVYGALVAMTDLPIELGFRLDTLPTTVTAEALAIALAAAYSRNRAGTTVNVHPMVGTFLPPGASAGGRCVYDLPDTETDDDGAMMEQLEVTVRAGAGTVLAMYYTVRFKTGPVNPVRWAHVRTAVREHQRFDGAKTTPPQLWPASAIAASSATLTLTDAAFAEAQAKAGSLGGLSDAEHAAIVTTLLELSGNDVPPSAPLPPFFATLIPAKIREAMPSGLSEILLANFRQVSTYHDLRAWIWQQMWAIGNRSSGG